MALWWSEIAMDRLYSNWYWVPFGKNSKTDSVHSSRTEHCLKAVTLRLLSASSSKDIATPELFATKYHERWIAMLERQMPGDQYHQLHLSVVEEQRCLKCVDHVIKRLKQHSTYLLIWVLTEPSGLPPLIQTDHIHVHVIHIIGIGWIKFSIPFFGVWVFSMNTSFGPWFIINAVKPYNAFEEYVKLRVGGWVLCDLVQWLENILQDVSKS